MEFTKENITKVVKSNMYKVIGIDIYAEETQATVVVKEKRAEMYRALIINKEDFENPVNNVIKINYQLFGLEKWFSSKLFL